MLEQEIPAPLMQQIAMENNLAETAYLLPQTDGYSLRWFTPSTEIRLCGHGTLATAHILWEKGLLEPQHTARFFTKSGLLTVEKKEDGLEMNFPAFTYSTAVLPEAMLLALGVAPVACMQSQDGRYMVEVADAQTLKLVAPDFAVLRNYESVVITCKAPEDSAYDFLSRSFAPSHGVNEDPVTGSSHCALVPYWARKLNKTSLLAYQASERGGELKLRLAGNNVLIRGKAVTVIEGILSIAG
jgi:PhzF family phenazine biosynthesis protein